jgi:amino acid transporter
MKLGSSIPVNGGAQAYLAYAYGPITSYLFAWTAIIALKPGTAALSTAEFCSSWVTLGGNAVISLIFAEYLNRLFWHATKAEVSPDEIPQWAIKLTAAVAVLLVSILGVATPKLGTRAAVVFTVVKVLSILNALSFANSGVQVAALVNAIDIDSQAFTEALLGICHRTWLNPASSRAGDLLFL